MGLFGKDKSADEWNKQGIASINDGKFDESIKCFDKALKLDPQNTTYLSNKGAGLVYAKQFGNALGCFDEAIKIEPHDDNVWDNKGSTLHKLERYTDAILSFDEAIKINPKNANAWNGKAGSLAYLGKIDDATVCFDEAIRLAPNNLMYQSNKTKILETVAEILRQNAIRKGWSESEKEQIRISQDGKCAKCQKPPPRWEYDHIDGNRSNDSLSNCQGLCPNCHSIKTNEE